MVASMHIIVMDVMYTTKSKLGLSGLVRCKKLLKVGTRNASNANSCNSVEANISLDSLLKKLGRVPNCQNS